MSGPPRMYIRQVTGPGRMIILSADSGSLPHAPAEWGVEAGVKVTWYPGNPVAEAQIGGHRFLPSTWHGWWKTTRLLRSPAPLINFPALVGGGFTPAAAAVAEGRATRAVHLWSAFDLLLREAQLLKVTWSRTVRYGFLTRIPASVWRLDDIEWDLEFTWIGEAQTPPQIGRSTSKDLLNAQRKLVELAQKALAKASAAVEALELAKQDLLGPVTKAAAAMDTVEAALASYLKALKSATTGVLDSAAGSIADARLAAYVAREALRNSRVPATADRSPLEARAANAAISESAAALSELLSQLLAFLLPAQPGATTYVTQTADTLRTIAARNLGNAARWTEIAELNNLSESTVRPGTVLVLPATT